MKQVFVGASLLSVLFGIALAPSSVVAADLSACIAQFRQELGRGSAVHLETYDRYVPIASDLTAEIAQKSASQPEFRQAIWDYLALAVDAERIDEGRQILAEQNEALQKIQARFGVDGPTVVAFFGIETNYGKVMGKYPVIDATLSRACLKPENAERRKQLFSALWLVQEGEVKVEDFRGSWAGAFGKTQFMPATFVDNRVDMDGDGRSDIIHSTPDALGTTARFVQKLRWQPGLPWAVEVVLPEGVASQAVSEREHGCLSSAVPTGRCKSLEAWARLGVKSVAGQALLDLIGQQPVLSAQTNMALIAPASGGPAWLATQNFQSMWGYNRSDAYALAIGLLSDALRGQGLNKTPWPVGDPGLSRKEVRELQQRLQAGGACEVIPDGMAGAKTVEAIRSEEQRLGWEVTGRPGQRLLNALRAAPLVEKAPCMTATGSSQ